MWGGVKGAVPEMTELVGAWSNRERYMGDLDFLNSKARAALHTKPPLTPPRVPIYSHADRLRLGAQVWPKPEVRGSNLAHDAYTCTKYPNSRPFPTRRPLDYQHVGQVFWGDGRPRQDDIDSFMIGREVPPACRGKPDWAFG